MGVLLGDGGLTKNVTITSGDPELFASVEAALPPGAILHRWPNPLTVSITGARRGAPNPVLVALRTLGVFGHLGHEKRIPAPYLSAPIADRVALLRGLLDTDGSVERTSLTFCSTSLRLAAGVRELVESLGGTARIRGKAKNGYRKEGGYRSCRESFRVVIKLPRALGCPVTIPRKAQQWEAAGFGLRRPVTRRIVRVSPSRYAPARCITVAAPDGLYLTEHHIVTHNSWLGLGTAVALACGGRALGTIEVEAGGVLYLALEDGPRRVQERLGLLLGDTAPPEWLTIATEWPRLDEGGLEAIEFWLAGHPSAHRVVIDTLKRNRPPGAGLRPPHNDQGDENVGAVDGAIVLQRKRGAADATLWITHRDAEDSELAIRWDAQTAGWLLLGDAEAVQQSAERAEILGVLAESPDALYPREIAEALDKPSGTVRRLLWGMVRAGQVRAANGRYVAVIKNPGNAGNAPRNGPWYSQEGGATPENGRPPEPSAGFATTVTDPKVTPVTFSTEADKTLPAVTGRYRGIGNAAGTGPNLGDTRQPDKTLPALPHFTDSDLPPGGSGAWSGPEPEPPWPRGGRQPP
jgi:hypothetical protein